MHTPLCGHAFGEPKEYVQAASDRGLHMITFTCHVPIAGDGFKQKGIRMQASELAAYRSAILEARQFGARIGVEVLYGIEAEIFPVSADLQAMHQLIAQEPFDFVLGSLHHMLPGFQMWLNQNALNTDEQIVAAYFDCLGDGAESGKYDSIAHMDVIRMYGTLKHAFHPAAYEQPIQRFLDRVAAAGVCMEINTSGLIKGDYTVHPDPLIMGWALQRNIPFTIGSDAHHPDMVGQFFDEIIPQFRSMGLKEIHFFRGRQRHRVPL